MRARMQPLFARMKPLLGSNAAPVITKACSRNHETQALPRDTKLVCTPNASPATQDHAHETQAVAHDAMFVCTRNVSPWHAIPCSFTQEAEAVARDTMLVCTRAMQPQLEYTVAPVGWNAAPVGYIPAPVSYDGAPVDALGVIDFLELCILAGDRQPHEP